MGDNKGRSYSRSISWSSQDGVNQKHYNWIRSRARFNYRKRSSPEPSITPNPSIALEPSITPDPSMIALEPSITSDPLSPPPTNTASALNDKNRSNNNINGIAVAVIVGSLILLTMAIYCLLRFVRKRNQPSDESSQQDQFEEELQSPPPSTPLTITFVKHNHPTPELCTTPDTQPILDYYSSKAGLALPPVININSDKFNHSDKFNPSEVIENTKKSEDNEYVPQYYNGMEIPPLGARIIPLERQVQIAKELTSANPNSINYKRKSNRSISSILSISSIRSINSKRKSSTSNNNNNNNNNNHNNYNNNHNNNNNNSNSNSNNNNNSSTTNSLTQISETDAKIVQ